ncbi:MAG: hypothetical protein V5804_13940 [Mucilaginibacter sp.]|uniref:hypothetical protein n=1 Tax=Mucilaginibacter sp. TaxID=1882438 RepID=UPI0034E3D658
MVETKVTPQKTDFDMAISLPEEYVGKEVHVVFYMDEEVKNHNEWESDIQKLEAPTQKEGKKTMANFWGIISDQTAEILHREVGQNRNGWDKNI